MATGQTILNLMEALSPELQLQSGESDVTKGLLILNAAQDLFESLIAQHPKVAGSSVGTLTTTANQEYTTFPTGLVRLDGIDFLDQTTLLPSYPVQPKFTRGGHRFGRPYWLSYVSATNKGQPTVYWTNRSRIYWDPVPDIIYTLRYYGFATASDITASGTFTYDDMVMLPLASLAVRIIRSGLDDPTQDIGSIAKETLNPVIDLMSNFNRDGAHSLRYDFQHDT